MKRWSMSNVFFNENIYLSWLQTIEYQIVKGNCERVTTYFMAANSRRQIGALYNKSSCQVNHMRKMSFAAPNF